MITIIVIPLCIVCIIIIVIINIVIIKLEDNNKYKDVGGVIGFDNIIILPIPIIIIIIHARCSEILPLP